MDTEQLKRGREKGMQSPGFGIGSHYKKYTYTTRDIARVTSRTEGTIRNDVLHDKLVMNDFMNVAAYIRQHMTEVKA